MKTSIDLEKSLFGKTIVSVKARSSDHAETASGGEEVELEFSDGTTLLVYVHSDGELHAEVD